MMIRKLFSTLALLLAAPSAFALDISADGAGQAILLPYYSLTDGMAAVFTVTNHAETPKAVRVVIAEGRNGRPALTFNLYLAGRDIWNGGLISQPGTGQSAVPTLVTNDDSCATASFGSGVPLRNNAYTGSRDDGLGTDPLRLHSGQIEIIELGTLTGTAAALAAARDCAALRDRFVGGVWETDPNIDVSIPSGRLSADMQLIDVAAGVAYGIEPLVLDGFSDQARHGPAGDAASAVRIYDPAAKNPQGQFEVRDMVVDGSKPEDAVSLLLMSTTFEGNYSVSQSLDARTRWAITFPTRPAYLDNQNGGEFDGEDKAPFHYVGASSDCPVETTWQTIDQSGELGDPQELPLCAQVNRIEVLRGAGPLTATQDLQFYADDLADGRIVVGLHPERHSLAYMAGGTPRFASGLPSLAIYMIEVRNDNAQPGLLASYAISGKAVRSDGYEDF